MIDDKTQRSPEDLLPLSPVVFSILSVLNKQIMSGYEIKKGVEAATQHSIATAVIYRHLRTMRDDYAVIQEVDAPNSDSDDARRQYFKLTPFGEQVYAAQQERR